MTFLDVSGRRYALRESEENGVRAGMGTQSTLASGVPLCLSSKSVLLAASWHALSGYASIRRAEDVSFINTMEAFVIIL